MYGIFTNTCPKNHPNVRKYTIHGAYGIYNWYLYIYIYLFIFKHTHPLVEDWHNDETIMEFLPAFSTPADRSLVEWDDATRFQ